MMSKEILYAAERLAGCVKHDVNIINNKLIKSFVNSLSQRPSYRAVDSYLKWLVKEIDDESALKYVQKPSQSLPDDTIVAIFHIDVWERMDGWINIDNLMKEKYCQISIKNSNPLIITMDFFKGYENEAATINQVNNYFCQLKKREPDPLKVEIVLPASRDLPDDAVIAKIHGDIWKKGPLFHRYPDK
jgi:hypothetical protein